MDVIERFKSYVNAGRPILYVHGSDFEVIREMIESVSWKGSKDEFCFARGGIDFNTKAPKSIMDEIEGLDGATKLTRFLDAYMPTDVPRVSPFDRFLVLENVHRCFDDAGVIARLKTIALNTALGGQDGYDVRVVVVSSVLTIPIELEKLITVVEIPPVTEGDIRETVKNTIGELSHQLPNEARPSDLTVEDLDVVVSTLRGLDRFEIRQIIKLAVLENPEKFDAAHVVPIILREKTQAIRKSRLLEPITKSDTPFQLGGLANLSGYLDAKAEVFRHLREAKSFRVVVPKGILIVGMPGCGKSLSAKACAEKFNMPLVRLDIGRLLGRYVGESEENMRMAICQIEAASPCVLWIDEVEKAFAGVGKDESGVTTRLFGLFLTWMQEKNSAVYVVATANDISTVPPELKRRGRFDEIFYVDLPNAKERAEIFKIHLGRMDPDWERHDIKIDTLVQLTNGPKGQEAFSGADIEAIVEAAVERAFRRRLEKKRKNEPGFFNESLCEDDLTWAIAATDSIGKKMGDRLTALREQMSSYVSASTGNWGTCD